MAAIESPVVEYRLLPLAKWPGSFASTSSAEAIPPTPAPDAATSKAPNTSAEPHPDGLYTAMDATLFAQLVEGSLGFIFL